MEEIRRDAAGKVGGKGEKEEKMKGKRDRKQNGVESRVKRKGKEKKGKKKK